MTRLSSLTRKLDKIRRELRGEAREEPVFDLRVLNDDEVDRLEYLIRKMKGRGLVAEDLPEQERRDYRRLMERCLVAGGEG